LLDPGAGERDVVGRAPQRLELGRETAVRDRVGRRARDSTEVDIREVAGASDAIRAIWETSATRWADATLSCRRRNGGRDLPDRDVAHPRQPR
jgi:hypothetical protein